MRFSILLSLFAGSVVVFGSPSVQLSERATGPFTPSETELLIRNDGEVNIYGRQVTAEEIYARDSALAVATGTDLTAREFLDDDEIQELVLRHLDYELEERDTELEPRAVAAVARAVVQGVIKIVQLIKGKIEKDKQVSTVSSFSHLVCLAHSRLVSTSAEESTLRNSSASPWLSSPSGIGPFAIPNTATSLTANGAPIGTTVTRNSLFHSGRLSGTSHRLNSGSSSYIFYPATRSTGSSQALSPVREMEAIST
jgi:hypothetical protein